MSKQIKNIFSDTDCPGEEMMLKYTSNRMKGEEKHVFERHIAGCAFCSEALEGLSLLENKVVKEDLAFLNKQIDGYDNKSRPAIYWATGVAASVIIMMLSGTWFYLKDVNKESISIETTKDKSPLIEQSPGSPSNNLTGIDSNKNQIAHQNIETISHLNSIKFLPPEVKADNEVIEQKSQNQLSLNTEMLKEEEKGTYSSEGIQATIPNPVPSVVAEKADAKVADRNEDLSLNMLAMVEDDFSAVSLREDKKEMSSNQRSTVRYKSKATSKVYKKEEVAKDKSLDDCPNCPKKTNSEIAQNSLQVLSMDYAMKKYQMKEYELAHKQFEEIIKENSSDEQTEKAKIYNALSLINLNRSDEAFTIVNAIEAGPGGRTTDAAKWIKAFILINKKENEKAKKLLQDLSSDPNFYQAKAREILSTLK
jgi:hypothetical protein